MGRVEVEGLARLFGVGWMGRVEVEVLASLLGVCVYPILPFQVLGLHPIY